MTPNPYSLAMLYHIHHGLHDEDIPFWMALANLYGDPILELGCGTGRVLAHLLAAGWQVVGLDNDLAMLTTLLQIHPSHTTDQLLVFQADLTAFHVNCGFGLICLPCNTFSTLESAGRHKLYSLVKKHLRSGGCFAASLPNPALLARLPRKADSELEDTFPHPLDGEPVQVSSSWSRDSHSFRLSWHYDHLLADGYVDRASITTTHHIIPLQNLLRELDVHGLEPAGVYGDFDFSPYFEDSPNLILLLAPQK